MCEMALKQMLKLQMLKKTHHLNDIKLTFDIHIELLHKKACWKLYAVLQVSWLCNFA